MLLYLRSFFLSCIYFLERSLIMAYRRRSRRIRRRVRVRRRGRPIRIGYRI